MSQDSQKALAAVAALGVGVVLIYCVMMYLPEFGSFPERRLGGFEDNSIGQQILERAPGETGAANVVTSVIWDYRGYDTVGEATVLFAAVAAVSAVFRVTKRREDK